MKEARLIRRPEGEQRGTGLLSIHLELVEQALGRRRRGGGHDFVM